MASMKDFADLKAVSKQLREQAEARAQAEAERARTAKVQALEGNLFKASIGGVKRLPESDRYVPSAPKTSTAAPAPARKLSQAEDDAAVLRESLSDLFEVDHYLENDPALNYAAPGIGPDVVKKMRKGHWPIQDELDLHGLRRDEARDSIGAFLGHATRRKLRCVRVIHGKGFGSKGQEPVLKSMVHSWLVQKTEVIAFCQARRSEGGDGALVVLLASALQAVR
ncbi:Smr/MutS family protein [Janthinobacterium aquaticum]|uniref:Smr/MutS family protein n=1 Tax=Janthinobacterium sp. FT58W TaxID=2654254 RepID=UPI001264D646|nr:Smr/MutS family protein [Janthinobacterium sp. FT58W]KAB8042766.1 DNA mismatch repair protein MutS [Janthinobacterium sp. FT58W]